MMIISGWTKAGKTSLAQTMAYYQALKKISSIWFTFELGWQELTRKFMLMDDEYQKSNEITPLPIFYPIDNRLLSLAWMEKQIIKSQAEHNVRIAYIDPLHGLTKLSDVVNASLVIGGLVEEIKRLTIKLKIPIVVMTDTKMASEEVMPGLYSPRDSSFIVARSDFTFTIWREPFKQKKSDDPMQNENVYTDRTILSLVANRRNGQTKRMALGMINGKLYPYEEYLNIETEEEGQELVNNMDKKNDVLTKTKHELSLGLDKKNTNFYDD